ncbi:MAG: hypothetical protein ABIM89_01065 [Mycobacteriales bacterium]
MRLRRDRAKAEPPPYMTAPERKEWEKSRHRERKRRLLRVGQVLMVAGALMAVIHMLAHLRMLGDQEPSGLVDLLAGYPMAGLILLLGAVAAGQ